MSPHVTRVDMNERGAARSMGTGIAATRRLALATIEVTVTRHGGIATPYELLQANLMFDRYARVGLHSQSAPSGENHQPRIPGPASLVLPMDTVSSQMPFNSLGRPVEMGEVGESSKASSSSRQPRAKRVAIACLSCRQRRTRCDGARPCRICEENGLDCEYTHTTRRVFVLQSWVCK